MIWVQTLGPIWSIHSTFQDYPTSCSALSLIKSSLYWPKSLPWEAFPGIWQYVALSTIKKADFPLSWKMTIVNSSSARAGLFAHLSHLCSDFCLASSYVGLVYVANVDVISYMQLFCCIQKIDSLKSSTTCGFYDRSYLSSRHWGDKLLLPWLPGVYVGVGSQTWFLMPVKQADT